MTTAINQERFGINAACTAAASFIKLYYELLDKKRHNIAKLYLPEAVLVWNGTQVVGDKAIQKFYEENISTSRHIVKCYDAQPVHTRAVGEQSTMLVTSGGFVNFQDTRYDFHQSFLITSQGDNWKVASDTFRFQEPIAV